MTPYKEILENYEEITPFSIYAADNKPLMVIGKGTATLDTVFKGETLYGTIREAYYVPGLIENLLSTSKLTNNGFTINLSPRGCIIKDSVDNIVACGTHNNGLTELRNVTKPTRANLTVAEIWHRRLGHPSDKRLEKASHHSEGMPELTDVHISCTACSQRKQTRKEISKGPAELPSQ